MSEQQNWNRMGEDILQTVQDALNTGDFKELNKRISDSVPEALQEAKRQGWKAVESLYTSANQHSRLWYTQKGGRVRRTQDGYQKPPGPDVRPSYVPQTTVSSYLPASLYKKKGKVSGWFARSIGGLGVAVGGISTWVTVFSGLAGGAALKSLTSLTWTVLLLLAGGLLLYRGLRKADLLRNADRYIKAMNGKRYMNIEDIGLHVGQAPSRVLKRIRAMIGSGIFPQGHLDQTGKCFMLDDVTFREYMAVEKQRRLAQEDAGGKRAEGAVPAQEKSQTREKPQREEKPGAGQEGDGWSALQAEGQGYIMRLRALNEDIPGEAVSGLLDRLELLLRDIFERVKKKPEEMGQMSRFMEYYLPTTLKLVEKYRDFDRVMDPGEDVTGAMAEIKKALEAINGAFAEFRDNMLRAEAFDASTDAQVLQTMLARSGLGQGVLEAARKEREQEAENG